MTDCIILCRSRIVISTCVTAGMLNTLGLSVGHFTHVFVDEAGQATEPECLVPVALLAGTQGLVREEGRGGGSCSLLQPVITTWKTPNTHTHTHTGGLSW